MGNDWCDIDPLTNLFFLLGGSYVCANFVENQSRNATVRVPTDRYTDWQTQDGFIIYPTLYAIAMGQIIYSYMTKIHNVTRLSVTNVHNEYWVGSDHRVQSGQHCVTVCLRQTPLELAPVTGGESCSEGLTLKTYFEDVHYFSFHIYTVIP